MRIVCDTNVLVSAVIYGGPPRLILSVAAHGGGVAIATSPALMLELERVLLYPKFDLPPSYVAEILAVFRRRFEIVYPSHRVHAMIADNSDNAVLEAAEAAAAEIVVSGDNHLLNLGRWESVRILSPAAFVAEIVGNGGIGDGT